ncbi:hypothetical protein GCM10022248_30600 [Nonomuraea soli]
MGRGMGRGKGRGRGARAEDAAEKGRRGLGWGRSPTAGKGRASPVTVSTAPKQGGHGAGAAGKAGPQRGNPRQDDACQGFQVELDQPVKPTEVQSSDWYPNEP